MTSLIVTSYTYSCILTYLLHLIGSKNVSLLLRSGYVPWTCFQRRRQSTGTRGAMGSFWGAHGERVEHEPITGVWGAAPSGVQGQSPWLGGQGGEAESFLALRRATDRANLYLLQYFQQSIIIK